MTNEKPGPAEMARRMGLAKAAIAKDPTLGGLIDKPLEPNEVTAGEIIEAIGEAVDLETLPAQVEMTGGGTATIYIGYAGPDGRYTLAIGPGSYRGPLMDGMGSLFYIGEQDLAVGPDDDGEGTVRFPDDLAGVAPAVVDALLEIDEQFVGVLKPCLVCGEPGDAGRCGKEK